MNYPFWDVPLLGGGLVIALIAIPHVFVSHFAVGGGIFLAWSERRALRTKNARLLQFLKRNSLFFVLVTLVFGAVTGVGIWFSIGLVHPPATSTLIHNFVFAWAIEWVFFVVEITAALLYYYGWDRVSPTVHQAIGWSYAGAAWASLFVINGILTFMLTPGRWLQDGTFWSAYFNPTHMPSVVLRTSAAFALAGLYALFMASREAPGRDHDMLVRYSSKWLFPASVGLLLGGIWYVSQTPPLAREITKGSAPAVQVFAAMSVGISAIIFLFAYFIAYRNPHSVNPAVAVLFLLLGLSVTGVTEWVREAVRKPYVIYDYMYSNAVLKDEVPELRRTGLLAVAKWVTIRNVTPANQLAAGKQVFELQCAICHTTDGYNSLRLFTKGWSKGFIAQQIRHLDELKGFMPPFAGNDAEREALAAWIGQLNPPPSQASEMELPGGMTSAQQAAIGSDVFDANCSSCHTLDDRTAIRPLVRGWPREYIAKQLTRLDELSGSMSPFDGTAAEREALATWLATLNPTAKVDTSTSGMPALGRPATDTSAGGVR